MLFHAYLKNAVAYVPTVVKLQTGADVHPVAVVSVAKAGLRGDLLDAIGRKNAIVPPPPKDNWRPPILLKYAEDLGCLSGASKRRMGIFLSPAVRAIAKDIGRKTVAKTSFLPGSTFHDVVERMIAILQGAAQK